MELATEYFIQGHCESQRDHSSIDGHSHRCHGDMRTSDDETVFALAPIGPRTRASAALGGTMLFN